MKGKFRLEIVTPNRLVLKEEDVDEFSAPGIEGYFTALPGHTPYLVLLSEGRMSYRKGKDWHYMTVLNGYAEVLPDHITVLAEKSEKADEIDIERAEKAKRRAEERIKDIQQTEVDFERARAALSRAILRLDVSKNRRVQ
jgi:F-type H+-transporting ATPase subunit epsilon